VWEEKQGFSTNLRRTPLTKNSCGCVGVCVYGLGNTVEFSIWRITFRKMSICLIFVVRDEICPYFLRYTNVSHYIKIHSRKKDSCVLQIAFSVNVRIFSNCHAGPSKNARPTSEKLLRFRRSFSSVMDPPVIQWELLRTVPVWESVKRLPLLYRHGTRL
jgi:hypothetical protein